LSNPGVRTKLPGSKWAIQRLIPDNQNLVWCIRTNPHLVAFDTQNGDLDQCTDWSFNDESFAREAVRMSMVASLSAGLIKIAGKYIRGALTGK
jgi:hypothetical protein